MPLDHSHTDYLERLVSRLRELVDAHDDAARRLVDKQHTVLAVALLDLFRIQEFLEAHYVDRKGGLEPRDPIGLLRSMILMAALGETSVDRWVRHLRGHPEDAILTGFPCDDLPSVGTYYHFIDRLRDGPIEERSDDQILPSERTDGHGQSFRRYLDADDVDADSQADKAASSQASVRERVAETLEHLDGDLADSPLPDDLTARLNTILFEIAVVPSAHKELLGDLSRLTVGADGSLVSTRADGHGQKVCSCDPDDDCDCARAYADPTAEWGWDDHDETFRFGHRLHVRALVGADDRDLPLHLSVTPGNVPDVIRAVDDDVRLARLLATHLPRASIRDAVRDAGYDATHYYRLLLADDQRPIIPFAQEPSPPIESRDGFELDDDGVPICPDDFRMLRHSFDADTQKLVYHCPAKRATHEDGEYVRKTDEDFCSKDPLCEPDSKMGPILRIPVDEDPRIHTAVPRGSPRWQSLYDERSCVERLFSRLKDGYGLGDRPFRRAWRFQMHAFCAFIDIHASAWVEERFGDEPADDAGELIAILERLADRQAAKDEVLDAA